MKERKLVSTSTRQTIAEQNLALASLYTPRDVARYLHVPIWAVLALLGKVPTDPDWYFHHFWRRFPPIAPDDEFLDYPEAVERVSFRQVADLFVRASTIHGLAELTRTASFAKDRWKAYQELIWRVIVDNWQEPMFFGQTSPAKGITRLLESSVGNLESAQRD